MIDTDKYEEDELEKLCNRAIYFEDEYKLSQREKQELLAEVKRLRKQLGRYTQFVLWVEEEHNEVFDEYEGKDEL